MRLTRQRGQKFHGWLRTWYSSRHVRRCGAFSSPNTLCLWGTTFRQRMATYHFSLLTSRDIRPCQKPLQMAYVHVTCLRSNGLARSTAALSLGVVLHRCDSVHCPIAMDWMAPYYTLLLFQSLCEPRHDSQTCRGSVSHGQRVSPWGLPCTGPWQEKSSLMAGFPPTLSGGHLCQHARHRVPDPALLPLQSL